MKYNMSIEIQKGDCTLRKKMTNLSVELTFFLFVFVMAQIILTQIALISASLSFVFSFLLALAALKNFEFSVN